jgi:hypothetical protein
MAAFTVVHHPSRLAEDGSHLRMTITIQPSSRRYRSAHTLSGISLSCDIVQRTLVSIRSCVFSRRLPMSTMACQSTPISSDLKLAGMWSDATLMISNSRSKTKRHIRSPASSSFEIPFSVSSTSLIADTMLVKRSATDGNASGSLPGGRLIMVALLRQLHDFEQGYSAASLCPSLALSLWISSSAASAITVPGGKIASAPALYSAS